MAITPTPNNSLFKGFVFDGEDSRDYGVYISGDAVFNAPERDVEMIEIPGRNGAFALDKGRFSNIEVTYPAGLFGATEADFAAGINALRNALASRKGYCRLEDDYNPNEYRMAVYKSGLDVTPAMLKAGEFDIVFECKPQRFRIDGDQPVKMTDGGVIDNPTLFEARPLLQVYGYGDIGVNGETITIDDTIIGNVLLANSASGVSSVSFSEVNIRTGDAITMNPSVILASNIINDGSITNLGVLRTEGDNIVSDAAALPMGAREYRLNISLNDMAFVAGTNSTKLARIFVGFDFTQGGETVSPVVEYGIEVEYTAGQISINAQCYPNQLVPTLVSSMRYNIGPVTAYSTKSALGEPLYFDMDIGEAYKIEGGELISVNNAVSFPAELPTLKPGANTITFDNTVDELDIVPRWWEV